MFKVNKKVIRATSVTSNFILFSGVYNAYFEQVIVCWVDQREHGKIQKKKLPPRTFYTEHKML